MSVPLPQTTSRHEAIGLLTPALGEEKAQSTVDAAASALGLSADRWSSAQLRGVFAHISMEEGLVGITARVVSRRLRPAVEAADRSAPQRAERSAVERSSPGRGAPDGNPPDGNVHERSAVFPRLAPAAGGPGMRVVVTARKPIEAVAELLGQALGADSAMHEVARAARALGLGDTVHFSEALQLLEHMTHEHGLVGIAAQFAKTRLHLLTW